jgi:putative chitinase
VSHITADRWIAVLAELGVRPPTAARWSQHFAAVVQPSAFSLGLSEIDDFVAQVLHESGRLERLEEGLSYSTASRIRAVWPSRFPTDASAQPFVRNPQGLADKVYGGRMGNTQPGDGWRHRGSGPIQVTGRSNFEALQRATGLPLLENPDLLRQPSDAALRVCVAWWEGNVPDRLMGDKVRVRRAVNGGAIGLDDTAALTDKASRLLT